MPATTIPPSRIDLVSPHALRPYPRNVRVHSNRQINQIAESIRRFGFTNPVLVSDEGEIIAGHGRVLAARKLGMAQVPTIRISHLSAAERRAYVLADNKLALNAGWDTDVLAIELQGLIDLDFDLSITGFSFAEIDLTLDGAQESAMQERGPEDETPERPFKAVSRQGDLWHSGRLGAQLRQHQRLPPRLQTAGHVRTLARSGAARRPRTCARFRSLLTLAVSSAACRRG